MKDPGLYIIHIHESLQKIGEYSQGDREAFLADPKTQDAVIRNFEVIGEATKRLPTAFTTAYPDIPHLFFQSSALSNKHIALPRLPVCFFGA